MRIYQLLIDSSKDFFKIYNNSQQILSFHTKADFFIDEELILEVVSPSFPDRIYFRIKVEDFEKQNDKLNTVQVAILPHQDRKIKFLEKLKNKKWERNYQRIPVSLDGAWSLIKPKLWHKCKITNIGYGGAMLQAASIPPHKSSIYLKFKLPNNEKTITIKGEIVWLEREGSGVSTMGMRFYEPTYSSTGNRIYKELRRFFRLCEIHGSSDGRPTSSEYDTVNF